MQDQNELLRVARELIKARRFQEARSILHNMPENPTARAWIQKLDQIEADMRRGIPGGEAVNAAPANTCILIALYGFGIINCIIAAIIAITFLR